MSLLSARFTIERKHAGSSLRRYLVIMDDGRKAWGEPGSPFNVYATQRDAEDFRRFRLGESADDAVVVRHGVH